jgi:hypothetical protein
LFTTEALRTQREVFAYRELPIGENSLSSFQTSTEIDFGRRHFCLSVPPDKQKLFSVPSPCLRGEIGRAQTPSRG